MGIGDRLRKMAFQPAEVDVPEVVMVPRQQNYQRGPSTFRIDPTRPSLSSGGGRTVVSAPVAEDPDIAADLDTVLLKCQSRGFHELHNMMKVLAPSIPDEGARIAAAIASVTAMTQLSPAAIFAAVQDRVTALEAHRTTFIAGLEAEVKATMQQYQQSLVGAQTRIREMEIELARLQKDAADFERELLGIEEKAGKVGAAFEMTFNRYNGELSVLLDRIL